MSAADILNALDLPTGSCVNQRIPKTLLVNNGAPTAADKRLINDGVERLQWHAAIKPTNSGIPEYRDEVRHYVEIAVLELTLRPRAKTQRLVELTHRSVPYPVVLIADTVDTTSLSMAHKRWSQGETNRLVLDGDIVSVQLYPADDLPIATAFLDAMAIRRQPQDSLNSLYQGWIDTIHTLHAAAHTGTFGQALTVERASARRDALQECATIEVEMTSLRAAAIATKQVARRVEINLELKRLKSLHTAAQAKL